MKFLIVGTPGSTPIPPDRGAALYQAATAWVEERLADGRFDCHYVYADQGGFAIANMDSHEQVFAEILSYPLSPFFDWKAKALADWRETYAMLVAAFSG